MPVSLASGCHCFRQHYVVISANVEDVNESITMPQITNTHNQIENTPKEKNPALGVNNKNIVSYINKYPLASSTLQRAYRFSPIFFSSICRTLL